MLLLRISLLILSLSMLMACRQDEKLSKKAKLVESTLHTGGEAILDSATGEVYYPFSSDESTQKEQVPVTRITYDETMVDLGVVEEGTLAKHTFSFKNTGNAPLIIQGAYGSCGCTVPKFSKDPIAPGGTGEIYVEFDSKGRPGANTKTVTVNANTVPQTTTLTFTVMVNSK
jgi:hypothetical protein